MSSDTAPFAAAAAAASLSLSLSEEERQWHQQRQELYARLYEGAKRGLNRDAVLASRALFTPGVTFSPKPFTFPNADDAVSVICAEIPPLAAERCHQIAQDLLAPLPRLDDGSAVAHISDTDTMHITLFHTSHPDELAPNAKSRHSADIEQLTTMLQRFKAFRVKPVRVLLASSGALIMLFECLDEADSDDASEAYVNANRAFSVDHLRKSAKETFEYMPKKAGTHTIVHSTLGRIVDPTVSDEALQRVYEQCEELTKRFREQPLVIRIENVWYLEMTHYNIPMGKKTTIALE